MDDCIFCKIVKGEIHCTKVYEDDAVLAFADINPIADGHTLLIPKVHAENIWEISPADMAAIATTAQKVAAGIRDAMQPNGVAVLQLNGEGAGQVVMHYHLHLVPRPRGTAELPITQWKLIPGDMEKIQALADTISAAIR